jgi:proteasome lid subunit RPN8/RPN11
VSAVVLPTPLRRELVAWAAGAGEREVCGVLLGTRAAARVSIVRVARVPNHALTDDAFVCDPGAIAALDAEARGAGLELVGFWHSHVGLDPRPSSRDSDGQWAGALTAVVCPSRSPAVRFWRFDGRTAIEVRVVASEACAAALEAHNLRLETP